MVSRGSPRGFLAAGCPHRDRTPGPPDAVLRAHRRGSVDRRALADLVTLRCRMVAPFRSWLRSPASRSRSGRERARIAAAVAALMVLAGLPVRRATPAMSHRFLFQFAGSERQLEERRNWATQHAFSGRRYIATRRLATRLRQLLAPSRPGATRPVSGRAVPTSMPGIDWMVSRSPTAPTGPPHSCWRIARVQLPGGFDIGCAWRPSRWQRAGALPGRG
jgi:hypothetical protein